MHFLVNANKENMHFTAINLFYRNIYHVSCFSSHMTFSFLWYKLGQMALNWCVSFPEFIYHGLVIRIHWPAFTHTNGNVAFKAYSQNMKQEISLLG